MDGVRSHTAVAHEARAGAGGSAGAVDDRLFASPRSTRRRLEEGRKPAWSIRGSTPRQAVGLATRSDPDGRGWVADYRSRLASDCRETMSDNTNDSFELSRRKALAGLGGIGTATALGGIGTYAQFTDTEEESVTFTAGGIDGIVRYGANYNGNTVKSFQDGYADNAELTNVTIEEDNGGVGLSFTLDDVKPGDYGCFSFGIEVQNNPAWAAACIGYKNDSDGTVFEPEVEPDGDLQWDGNNVTDNGGGVLGTYDPQSDEPILENASTNGELPHELLFIPFYGGEVSEGGQFDPCIFFDEETEEFDAAAYEGSNAVSTPSQFWDNATDDLKPATLLQVLQQSYVDTISWGGSDGFDNGATGENPADTTIVNPPGVAEGCVFLNGEISTENEKQAAPIQPGNEFRFGWDWHLPFDTGNDVQGDSMTLNLGFTFSQVRHTENVTLNNIYSPGDNTPN